METSEVDLPEGTVKVILKAKGRKDGIPDKTTLDISTKLANRKYDSTSGEKEAESELEKPSFYLWDISLTKN